MLREQGVGDRDRGGRPTFNAIGQDKWTFEAIEICSCGKRQWTWLLPSINAHPHFPSTSYMDWQVRHSEQPYRFLQTLPKVMIVIQPRNICVTFPLPLDRLPNSKH